MQKFENVDVLAALEQIMRQNTAFYQSDFDIDKDIIRRDAASESSRRQDPALDGPGPPGRTVSGNVMFS